MNVSMSGTQSMEEGWGGGGSWGKGVTGCNITICYYYYARKRLLIEMKSLGRERLGGGSDR